MESIRTNLGNRSGDFITAVDEKSIIVVKELEESDGNEELEQTARMIIGSLEP